MQMFRLDNDQRSNFAFLTSVGDRNRAGVGAIRHRREDKPERRVEVDVLLVRDTAQVPTTTVRYLHQQR